MTAKRDDEWEEDVTRATFGSDSYEFWAPSSGDTDRAATPMPADLLEKIAELHQRIRTEQFHGRPRHRHVTARRSSSAEDP